MAEDTALAHSHQACPILSNDNLGLVGRPGDRALLQVGTESLGVWTGERRDTDLGDLYSSATS